MPKLIDLKFWLLMFSLLLGTYGFSLQLRKYTYPTLNYKKNIKCFLGIKLA